ncbi:MAG TPA: type II toxin-antitoxin system HicA family toxin [Acidimicrobiia bacterium]|nr:type II toxin-antitoxin system HicA family toxin [Acidimicrobiia bacterium]
MRPHRLLERISRGDAANVAFADLVRLVEALGFDEVGGRGSHRVFAHPEVVELVNLQVERGQAKRYQVRQIGALVRRYDLRLEEDR